MNECTKGFILFTSEMQAMLKETTDLQHTSENEILQLKLAFKIVQISKISMM